MDYSSIVSRKMLNTMSHMRIWGKGMGKRILTGTIIAVVIILTSMSSVVGSEVNSQRISVMEGAMWTEGPIREWIAEIDLIDGSPSEVEQIENILNRPYLRILPFRFIKVSDLDFRVTYKRNSFMLAPLLSYSTVAADFDGLEIVINRAHTVTVTNLDGFFVFIKTIPLRPARFFFFGQFEEITISR